MKRIKVLLAIIAFGLPTLASANLNCTNPATGATMSIFPYQPRASGITEYTDLLQMNPILVSALSKNRQAVDQINFQPWGAVKNSNPSSYYFIYNDNSAGDFIQVMSVSGGIKVLVSNTKGYGNSDFYFNPGECQFN